MPKPRLIVALLVACAALPLHAAPDSTARKPAAAAQPAAPREAAGDAVLHLLQDKGLLPTSGQLESSPLVQQVRDKASEMVMQAMNFIGVRYRRGGNSAEEGFDCSGFTRHVFEHSLGLVLPRRADQQATQPGLLNVKRDELKPGDLVFFNTMKRAFSHVGIYVGDGKFIHAPRTGFKVRVEDMRIAYWEKRFNGARRAEGALKLQMPLSAAVAAPATPADTAAATGPADARPELQAADTAPPP